MTPLNLTLAKRSVGAVGVPVLVALVAVNIAGRTRPWTLEWFWAIYNYHFLTVLVGPVAAGLAAWEGYRWAQARDLIGTSNRALGALVRAWAWVFAWVVFAYLIGILIVVIMVLSAGTPGGPGLREVSTIGPPLALLAAQTAAGFAVGTRFPSRMTAPAVAVTVFALSLMFYINGPGALIIVGGASDSLIGLEPRPVRQLAQVAWFTVAAGWALLFAARYNLGVFRQPRLLLPAVSAPAVAVLFGLIYVGDPVFERVHPNLPCHGSAPQICVGEGYAGKVDAIRDDLSPFVQALRDSGVTPPARFSQDADPGDANAAPLPIGLIRGDREQAIPAVLSWYTPANCEVSASPDALRGFTGLTYWLTAEATGKRPEDPTVPQVLVVGAPAAQQTWVQQAVRDVKSCRV